MKFIQAIILVSLAATMACTNATKEKEMKFDIQGHRGARGLMPENTLPAFLLAVDLGVTTLEMDLAVTKDGELLVSHEPYMGSEYCLDKAGNEIPDSAQLSYNIYQMSFEEISLYDCGSKPHPRFPEQVKMKINKPLLKQVIDSVETYTKAKNLPEVAYNIEIKSEPRGDGLFHPGSKAFSDMVFNELNGNIDWDRITVQSFDFRILQYFHANYPQVRLAVLIENVDSIQENLETLGFTPPIYSCDFVLLSRENVDQLHQKGMKVIPWTVNEPEDMKRLISWGVDGLITDYPNRYNQLSNE